jgi:hypothetical protein
MSQHNRFAVSSLAAAIGAGALMIAPAANANQALAGAWSNYYGTSSSLANADCKLCHGDDNLFPLNPYGADWRDALLSICGTIESCNLNQLEAGLDAIAGLDSDAPNDLTQSSNLVEINANTQPGWAESDAPAGVTGDLDPQQQVAGCVPFVDPSVLDFGNVLEGDSATLSAFVTNNGDENCLFTAQVNNASGEFLLESAASFSVAPAAAVPVDVSYTPIDPGDDTGQLLLTEADSIIQVQLVGTSGAELVNLDIKSLRVTNKVSVTKGKGIVDIQLSVENVGDTEGNGSATITGVQDQGGTLVPVYSQTLTVTDDVGKGATTYTFQSYIPDAAGDIIWTATIIDGDPDDDIASATTTVTP